MIAMTQDPTVRFPEEIAKATVDFFGLASVSLMAVGMLGIVFMITVIAPDITARCSASLRQRNVVSFMAGIPIALFFLGVLHLVS